MTRLTATAASIELANTDTQFVITDISMDEVEVYLEYEEDTLIKRFAVGIFKRDQISGLSDLMYLRYSRGVKLNNEIVNYDA